MYTPYTPLLYSETGFTGVWLFFLIFATKHRLGVLVRTASARQFLRVPTIYVLSTVMTIQQKVSRIIFTKLNVNVAHYLFSVCFCKAT